MWGLPQKQNARRAYKIRLCGHLRRYKKIVKKTYMISFKFDKQIEECIFIPWYRHQIKWNIADKMLWITKREDNLWEKENINSECLEVYI